MTHEYRPGSEAPDGPEHEHSLPDARDVPVTGAAESDSDALLADYPEEA